MKGRTRIGALVLGCALALALPSAASARIFLELDGIQGESDVVGFENQIELGSFQFGVGKGGNKAVASFSEITVTKQLDRSTPTLMLRTATGATIPSAKIRFTRGAEEPIVFLRYCLTGVRVTSFSQSSGGDAPSESVSLSYATIVQSYTQQGPGGGGTVFDEGWDLMRNLALGTACND